MEREIQRVIGISETNHGDVAICVPANKKPACGMKLYLKKLLGNLSSGWHTRRRQMDVTEILLWLGGGIATGCAFMVPALVYQAARRALEVSVHE